MPYKNIEDRRRCQAKSYRARQLRLRLEITELLGGKCVRCGFSDFRALHIDHISGGGSQQRKQWGGSYYAKVLKLVQSGNEDYQLLCANCNQIKKTVQRE